MNLTSLSTEKKRQLIQELTPEEIIYLYNNPQFFMLPHQVAPAGKWRYHLLLGGRGSGKSHAGIAWLVDKLHHNGRSVGICGADYNSVTNQLVPTFLSWYQHLPENQRPYFNQQKMKICFPADARGQYKHVYLYSSEKDVRGPNLEYLLLDEVVAWLGGTPNVWDRIQERFEVLDFAVRSTRITNPQIFIASTPAPMPFFINYLQEIEKNNPLYSYQTASTYDNKYLSEASISALKSRYEGTRLGRQELFAELLLDVPGALWSHANIEASRISPTDFQHSINNLDLQPYRTVLALDPSVSDSNRADETGIIVAQVAQIKNQNHAFIIRDLSGQYSPDQWIEKVVTSYHEYQVDCLVAEKNQGGLLISRAIKSHPQGRLINLKLVHAKKGKLLRAEPVAALYQQQKVHHVGVFPELEREMTTFSGQPAQKSPGRLDALTYSIIELLLDQQLTKRDLSNLGTF